ncbi:MAG: S8 family serine peptidase [Fidelibacterota bacterium]
MSFKTVEFDVISQSIRDALQYGRDGKGTMVVKSSGNTEGGGVTYPGTVPGVLVVGAVDRYGDPQYYTASDPEVDVVAPSSEYGPCDYNDIGIWSIDRDPYGYSPNFCDEYHGDNEGKYFSNFTGTSAAAPQVAGIGALLLSLDPSLEARAVGPDKNPELQDIIKESAIDLGDYDWAGHGLVNAYYAVAPPAAPQNLTLTNEGGNPRLNWDANTEPDLDKYHVYKRLTYNCPPTCDTENFMFITDENTYIDNGFDIGGRPPFDLAEYWIKAVDIGGQESSSSNSVIKPGHQTAQWKELVEMAPNVPEDYNLSANSQSIQPCHHNPLRFARGFSCLSGDL